MTKSIGIRPAPKHLLPQECCWQLLEQIGTKGKGARGADWDLGPPCGKEAYWVIGPLAEVRFYCKKHGQIIWDRAHRYRQVHNSKGVKSALRSKEKGKQVRSSKPANKEGKGDTPK